MNIINPFAETAGTDRIEYEQYLTDLKSCIDDKIQTVLLGVEGSGKTILLNSLLRASYRKKVFEETNTLIAELVVFNEDAPPEKIYTLLCNAIDNALRNLELQEKGIFSLASYADPKEKFTAWLSNIKNKDYRVVFLIDTFEEFASSPKITEDHHDCLREAAKTAQFILATDYDLNKDSLPPGIWNSFFIQLFSGGEITIESFSEAEAQRFLAQKTRNKPYQFSPALVNTLYQVSGGIPYILREAACLAYEHIAHGKAEADLRLREALLGAEAQKADKSVFHRFKKWCRMLTPQQIQVLHNLATGATARYQQGMVEEDLHAAASALQKRGLLRWWTETLPDGRTIVDPDRYVICCRLYNSFCRERAWLENAAAQNPLKKLQPPPKGDGKDSNKAFPDGSSLS